MHVSGCMKTGWIGALGQHKRTGNSAFYAIAVERVKVFLARSSFVPVHGDIPKIASKVMRLNPPRYRKYIV